MSQQVVIRTRNGADNTWIDQIVPVVANAPLKFDANLNPTVGGPPAGTPTTIATAGAGTYTAAQIATGVIVRDCAGASRADTLDTAAALIALIPQLFNDYGEYSFLVYNNSGGAYTITLTAGASITTQGTMTIAQNSANRVILIRTSATTLVLKG